MTQGYRVVRIANNEVLTNLESVVDYLLSVLAETPRVAANAPLPPWGGGQGRG